MIWDLRHGERLTELVPLRNWFHAQSAASEPMRLSVPLTRLMAEEIKGLRRWSSGRARPATPHLTASEPTLRKLGV